jgi:saccharopine dehydrogenase (NAD+, L-lysine-forming)
MPQIGIRREDKNEWERRVPLTPDHVKDLIQHGVDVFVQPSRIRVFPDEEYEKAGVEDQAYMFFAHVIKGQKYNMPMLRKLMDTGCTLLDYEKVTDDANRRLIFFGNFAGLAGMLETFYTLGKRLEWEGVKSPFSALKRPLEYGSLGEAKVALAVVGKWIEIDGLPEGIAPLVVGFAGYGNVSRRLRPPSWPNWRRAASSRATRSTRSSSTRRTWSRPSIPRTSSICRTTSSTPRSTGGSSTSTCRISESS